MSTPLPLTEPTYEALAGAMRRVMGATTIDRIVATSPDGVLLGEASRDGTDAGYCREFAPALYGLARAAAEALDWGPVSTVLVDIAVLVDEKPVVARTLVASSDPQQATAPIFLVSAPRSDDHSEDIKEAGWAAAVLPRSPAAISAAAELGRAARITNTAAPVSAVTVPTDLPVRPRGTAS